MLVEPRPVTPNRDRHSMGMSGISTWLASRRSDEIEKV